MRDEDRRKATRERVESFRARGFKVTPQRTAILQALLDSKRHLTAEEVYEVVKQDFPMVSRTTVYRNLESLVEAGLLLRLQRSGRALQYDANLEEHHHFFCGRCGAVIDIYLDRIEYHIDHDRSPVGEVRVVRPEIQLHGICSECLQKDSQDPG